MVQLRLIGLIFVSFLWFACAPREPGKDVDLNGEPLVYDPAASRHLPGEALIVKRQEPVINPRRFPEMRAQAQEEANRVAETKGRVAMLGGTSWKQLPEGRAEGRYQFILVNKELYAEVMKLKDLEERGVVTGDAVLKERDKIFARYPQELRNSNFLGRGAGEGAEALK